MGYRPIDPAFREIIVDYRKSGTLLNNAVLAQAFSVCEGTIRYWLKREGMHDLRRDRPSGVDAWRSRIEDWVSVQVKIPRFWTRFRPEINLWVFGTIETRSTYAGGASEKARPGKSLIDS